LYAAKNDAWHYSPHQQDVIIRLEVYLT